MIHFTKLLEPLHHMFWCCTGLLMGVGDLSFSCSPGFRPRLRWCWCWRFVGLVVWIGTYTTCFGVALEKVNAGMLMGVGDLRFSCSPGFRPRLRWCWCWRFVGLVVWIDSISCWSRFWLLARRELASNSWFSWVSEELISIDKQVWTLLGWERRS